MSKILVLLGREGNRRVLTEWLGKKHLLVDGKKAGLFQEAFDLAILDGKALEESKAKVEQCKNRDRSLLLPFLLLISQPEARDARRFLGTVADDILVLPTEKVELEARIENLLRLRDLSLQLRREHEEVERLTVTDDVSGFHNTRFLHQFLDDYIAKGSGRDRALSLAFFDMDGFKKVVDTHGHPLGAKVLKEVAEVVHGCLDPSDRIVRYGGDEYIVILPGHSREDAVGKVERIRSALVATPYLQDEGINVHLTASFGMATYPLDAETKAELLARADECLFRSKGAGKDRITVYSAGGEGHSRGSPGHR